MEERSKPLLIAAGLSLLPALFLFPVVAMARFGPSGPANVWPVAFYAPIAMWMQIRSIKLLLGMYRRGPDPALFAILPLGLVSLFNYALEAALFILFMPALLYRFI
jgi:hypothetical protein